MAKASVTRVALYTRISRDRVDETGIRKAEGVKRQLADCTAYAAQQPGWEIVGHYEDDDKSAFAGAERPDYLRMISDIRAKRVDVVLAYDVDRLWRDVGEVYQLCQLAERVGMTKVETPRNRIDLSDANSVVMLYVSTAFAMKSSIDTRRRIIDQQRHAAEAGHWHGGRRPFGYRHAGKGQGLVVDEKEAALIRDGVERVLAGASTRSLVMKWQAAGVPTVTGTPWTVAAVSGIMQGYAIAGLRVRNGVTTKAAWQAIISPAQHEAVLALFSARKRPHGLHGGWKYLMSGFLRCGACGGRMTSQPVRGVLRYKCPSPGFGGCGGSSATMHAVDDHVRDLVLEYIEGPKLTAALERQKVARSDHEHSMTELLDRLAVDRSRLLRLEDDLVDEVLDRAAYKRQRSRYEARIAHAESQIAQRAATAGPAASLTGLGRADLEEFWTNATSEERRTVIGSVAEHFTIDPGIPNGGKWNPARVTPSWRF